MSLAKQALFKHCVAFAWLWMAVALQSVLVQTIEAAATAIAAAPAAPAQAAGSFNCSQPPQFENFDISKCCRLPSINLGPAVEKCHRHIKTLKSFNPSFPVYAHVCYPECIYRETGSFIEGDIHMETVKNFLQNNIEQRDKIIVPIIAASFQTCMTNIKH
uniref:Uncharacterized protein n=1 Tax=Stomoxys calcitrans TaxID=35570 RepID=A0A1I8NQG4_STOCA